MKAHVRGQDGLESPGLCPHVLTHFLVMHAL